MRRSPSLPLSVSLAWGFLACTPQAADDDAGTRPDAGQAGADAGNHDGGRSVDGGQDDGGVGCDFSTIGASDKPRVVIVSHPYVSDGGNRGREIRSLTLFADGGMVDDGNRFDVGFRVARLRFVPSGEMVLALGEDGELASLRVESVDTLVLRDTVTLPSAGYTELLVHPNGHTLFAVGSNVAETSGISVIELGCDGTLTVDESAFLNVRLAESFVLRPGADKAILLGGQAVFEPVDTHDLRLLQRADAGFVETASFDIWQDFFTTERMALSPDGTVLVIPNGSPFSNEANQLLVVAVADESLTETQRLMDLNGPAEAQFSVDGNTVLVTQPEANRVAAFAVSNGTLTAGTPVGGIGLADQMAMVERGALSGLVLLPSVDVDGTSNVARVRITGAGTLEDDGQFNLGTGFEEIPNAIAVTP